MGNKSVASAPFFKAEEIYFGMRVLENHKKTNCYSVHFTENEYLNM